MLRARYKCVLFTDTDEFVIPDPSFYPKGLKQYFEKFIAETSLLHRRTSGMELAHISFGNGSFSFNSIKNASALTPEELQSIWSMHGYIEPPMNWSKSILSQRKYWIPVLKYSKPLLTKIPLKYRPGFHNNFVGPFVVQDSQLFLIHLRSADYSFCMEHEKAKYETAKNMHPQERQAGFNDHIVKFESLLAHGAVCAFSVGCYLGPWIGNQTAVYDTTAKIRLIRMDDAWVFSDL